MMGIMGSAAPSILAAFLDGERKARQERDRQKAWSASNLRLDILYGFATVTPQGCRMAQETEAVEKVEAPCLSCGASHTAYERGRRCCAYCGSDR